MLDVLFDDSFCTVINKPAGLFSQSARGVPSALDSLTDQLNAIRDDGVNSFLRLVHRLDQATSGCLLFARNQRAARRLSEQFAARKVSKSYLAVVEGCCTRFDEPQQLQDWIRKVPGEARAEIVKADLPRAPDSKDVKFAQLTCRSLLTTPSGRTVLLVHLHTGRMHQIRVQLASRGIHVVGDDLYRGADSFQTVSMSEHSAREEKNAGSKHRLGLHAWKLTFRHPKTAKEVVVRAPIPGYWQDWIGTTDQAMIAWEQLNTTIANDDVSPIL